MKNKWLALCYLIFMAYVNFSGLDALGYRQLMTVGIFYLIIKD